MIRIPHRRALADENCAVGRPVRVEQVDNPTMEQLQDLQTRYIAELMRSVPHSVDVDWIADFEFTEFGMITRTNWRLDVRRS